MDLAQKTLFRPSDCQTDNKFVIPNTFSVCLEKIPENFTKRQVPVRRTIGGSKKDRDRFLKLPPIMPYCTTSKHVAA
jgi:hypothetical protein